MFQSGFICVILTEKMHDLWQWRGKMQQNRVFCAMTGKVLHGQKWRENGNETKAPHGN